MGKARAQRWQAERKKHHKLVWIAFVLTELNFVVEIGFGIFAMSGSLQIDALETSNPQALLNKVFKKPQTPTAQGRGQIIGGMVALLMCLWCIGLAIWNNLHGIVPNVMLMSVGAGFALTTNTIALFLLRRMRADNASLAAAWTSARNDVLGNLVVLAAAAGVYYTNRSWPDAFAILILLPFTVSQASKAIREGYALMR